LAEYGIAWEKRNDYEIDHLNKPAASISVQFLRTDK
jgi:hypothetical protein